MRLGAELLLKAQGIPDLNLIKQAKQGCEASAMGRSDNSAVRPAYIQKQKG